MLQSYFVITYIIDKEKIQNYYFWKLLHTIKLKSFMFFDLWHRIIVANYTPLHKHYQKQKKKKKKVGPNQSFFPEVITSAG